MHCVGYVRVSTAGQADDGGGIPAQCDAIRGEVERRGWDLVDIVCDAGLSGGVPLVERPGGRQALGMLADGKASVLLVSRLDRLTRSSRELAGLLECLHSGKLPEGIGTGTRRRRTREKWALVSCDVAGLDMTSPAGELVATMLGAANRMERRLIGARTSEALRAKQAAGVQLGRKLDMSQDVRALVLKLHASTRSTSATARELNARGVPTARGGHMWRPSNVQRVVEQSTRTVQPVRVNGIVVD